MLVVHEKETPHEVRGRGDSPLQLEEWTTPKVVELGGGVGGRKRIFIFDLKLQGVLGNPQMSIVSLARGVAKNICFWHDKAQWFTTSDG